MGGHQSRTRKLTVENDDPTSVIKVSDDVVQRIKNSHDTKPASPEPTLHQQAAPPPPPPVTPQPALQPLYVYEPSLTTVQLRQANLAELKKNDHYWENRLKNQQEQHKKINEILETEYKKTLEDMEVTDKEPPSSKALPPCQDAKKAVLKCYRENSRETMNCAHLVQAFQQCVDSERNTIITNRG